MASDSRRQLLRSGRGPLTQAEIKTMVDKPNENCPSWWRSVMWNMSQEKVKTEVEFDIRACLRQDPEVLNDPRARCNYTGAEALYDVKAGTQNYTSTIYWIIEYLEDKHPQIKACRAWRKGTRVDAEGTTLPVMNAVDYFTIMTKIISSEAKTMRTKGNEELLSQCTDVDRGHKYSYPPRGLA